MNVQTPISIAQICNEQSPRMYIHNSRSQCQITVTTTRPTCIERCKSYKEHYFVLTIFIIILVLFLINFQTAAFFILVLYTASPSPRFYDTHLHRHTLTHHTHT